LITSLKADGVWTTIDWLCLLANETAESALRNVKQPSKTATAVNSPTFTTDRGYTGNGTDAHISLGEAWDAVGNTYSRNSASFGIVVNQQNDVTLKNIFGTDTSTNATITVRGSVGTTTLKLNASVGGTFVTDPGSKLGHWSASRRDSANMYGYLNGALVASIAQASAAVGVGNVTVLRMATVYDSSRVSAFWFGSGMTDAQVLAVHTRLTTYLTAIGAATSTALSGLSDNAGSWIWAEPGDYGLIDDTGSWSWSASPTYRLNSSTLTWE
jgi:hypothetical protein